MARRSFEKRLRRQQQRAQARERSYRRLAQVVGHAALFMAGAIAVMLAVHLFTTTSPPAAPPGRIAQVILRHYTPVFASAVAAYFGAVFTFRFLAPTLVLAPFRLVFLGGVFGIAAHFSMSPAVQLSNRVGAVVWLFVLAAGITYAGARLFSRAPRWTAECLQLRSRQARR